MGEPDVCEAKRSMAKAPISVELSCALRRQLEIGVPQHLARVEHGVAMRPQLEARGLPPLAVLQQCNRLCFLTVVAITERSY